MAVPLPPGRVIQKDDDPKFIVPRYLQNPVTPEVVQAKRERYVAWMREREPYQMAKLLTALSEPHDCPHTPPVTPKCSRHPGRKEWETVTLKWRASLRKCHQFILETPHLLTKVQSKMKESGHDAES